MGDVVVATCKWISTQKLRFRENDYDSTIGRTRACHHERLRRVRAVVGGGEYTAFELVPRIWKQKLGLIDQRLAMAEALSHLHFLRNRGDLVSGRRGGRVVWASEPRPSVPAS